MKIRILIYFTILGTTMAWQARATTLVRLSLEQLSQASTVIARGHVLTQESRWNSAHTQILTLTTIAVAGTLKGSPPPTLIVQQLGGTVGNIRVHVSGEVHFYPDTDYLLFLEPARTDPAKFLVVGMMQGAYRIYRDQATREERVIRPLAGYVESPHATGLKVSDQTVALGAFRQQVVDALQNPIVIPRGTSLPVAIASAQPRGVERVQVLGRTATDIYPSAGVVVPAGSALEGTGQLVSGVWKIHWTELSIRGTRVEINATSEESRGRTLKGRALVVTVR